MTIAIPTFNRADNLDLLLRSLQPALTPLRDSVRVLVSDNASTDRTPQLLAEIKAAWPELTVHRNAENIGVDRNFCGCIDRIDSKYFWLMGDDDLPKTGVIDKLVALLRSEAPDMVYLESEWVNPIVGPNQGAPVPDLRPVSLDRFDFAKRIHIWFTFISGIVINRECLQQSLEGQSIRRHVDTNLVQLGWVFPVLKQGSKFLHVTSPSILATSGNTGGYTLVTVFGVNFSRIARATFGEHSRVATVLVRRALSRHLPRVVWQARCAHTGQFKSENPWPAMRGQLGGELLFWTVLLPLGKLPKPLAGLVFGLWSASISIGSSILHWVTRVRRSAVAR